MHCAQIKEILKYGRDIIVEKPCFTNVKDIKAVSLLTKNGNHIIYEAFMHKHTKLYQKFIEFWFEQKQEIINLKSFFYIPTIPKNTFRDQNEITSSCLYDMGCYSLSLLADMGLKLDTMKIENIVVKILNLSGELKGIVNSISLKEGEEVFIHQLITKSNKKTEFWPFFQGKKTKKFISQDIDNNVNITKIEDYNAFEEMFDMNKNDVLLTQKIRFKKMLNVTEKLELLAEDLKIIMKTKL